jgi:hypothetical protein
MVCVTNSRVFRVSAWAAPGPGPRGGVPVSPALHPPHRLRMSGRRQRAPHHPLPHPAGCLLHGRRLQVRPHTTTRTATTSKAPHYTSSSSCSKLRIQN